MLLFISRLVKYVSVILAFHLDFFYTLLQVKVMNNTIKINNINTYIKAVL